MLYCAILSGNNPTKKRTAFYKDKKGLKKKNSDYMPVEIGKFA
jgi:hypothetical protein